MKKVGLVLVLLLLVTPTLSKYPIKHVIVLMLENRSFDHLLGFLHKDNPDIDGLTGDEYNLVDVSDPKSEKIYVSNDGYDEGPDDPNHDFWATAEQIYGFKKPNDQDAKPEMNGFAQNAEGSNHNLTNPFAMFTKDTDSAPIINTLATEFAVFDRWFASIPGPTDPNRAYAMSATSVGTTTNFNGTLWTQQSYFDFLREHGKSFHGYYEFNLWAIFYFNDTVNNPDNHKRMKPMRDFFIDLELGNLAEFTWLQPSCNAHVKPASWQHPDNSVREGERLIKRVYEALAKSKFFDDTLLIITYDEHGGFFDHVSPPQDGIPNPDGIQDPDGFDFDRLGIRVPTIAISPWINKGTVVHEPNGPESTSQFDHTSTLSTTNKILGIDDTLTARSAWAGTFDDLLLVRDSPRTDCPKKLPDLPDWTLEDLEQERLLPLNEHLRDQILFFCTMNDHGEECGGHVTNAGEAADFLEIETDIFLNSLRV